MNADQAKRLDLPAILAALGHKPVKTAKGGTELWYRSPFRVEKEPSFVVSVGKVLPWVYNDFGDDGGTVIDFALRYNGINSISEALKWLKGIGASTPLHQPKGPTLFSSNQQAAAQPQKFFSEERDLQFISSGSVRNPVILRYLRDERFIPLALVERYILEIHYRQRSTDRAFFAFGMMNRSGGYEIRAASDSYRFKSALNGRDVSIYQGSDEKTNTLNVFEGMLDFLSLMALYEVQQLKGCSLILHSLSSLSAVGELVKKQGFIQVNAFLDNDDAGRKAMVTLTEEVGECIRHQNELYNGHNDVNDLLKATMT